MDVEPKQHDFVLATPEEVGVMQVSKWQEFHLQLDVPALKKVFSDLGLSYGYCVGQIVPEDGWKIPFDIYASDYGAFLDADDESLAIFRKKLSMGLSLSPDSFYAKRVSGGIIVTPKIPYIQVRVSTYTISKEGKILPGALGTGTKKWGLHFAYPVLSMNSKEGIARNVLTEEGFINTSLFKSLQKWVREYTKPATLMVGDSEIKTTMRCMR